MTLIINSGNSESIITNNNEVKAEKIASEGQEIKMLLEHVLSEKGIDTEYACCWIDEKSFEVRNVPASALHTFMLEAEKLGKSIGFEKRTIIRIA